MPLKQHIETSERQPTPAMRKTRVALGELSTGATMPFGAVNEPAEAPKAFGDGVGIAAGAPSTCMSIIVPPHGQNALNATGTAPCGAFGKRVLAITDIGSSA
jgi:hypothetical protein